MPLSCAPGVQERGRRWTRLNASQHRIEVHAALVPLTSLFTAFKGKEFTGPYMEHKAGGEFLAKNARITVLKVRFLPAPPPERDDGAKILAESEDVGARLKRFKVVVKYASLYDAYFTDKDFKLEKEGA